MALFAYHMPSSLSDEHTMTKETAMAFRILQYTLQLQLYQKSGKRCIVVVYSTPAIVNIIIWWGHDSVVDHYTVFAPTKSVIY